MPIEPVQLTAGTQFCWLGFVKFANKYRVSSSPMRFPALKTEFFELGSMNGSLLVPGILAMSCCSACLRLGGLRGC